MVAGQGLDGVGVEELCVDVALRAHVLRLTANTVGDRDVEEVKTDHAVGGLLSAALLVARLDLLGAWATESVAEVLVLDVPDSCRGHEVS